jgi:3-mercaptopropionate dioxygenase
MQALKNPHLDRFVRDVEAIVAACSDEYDITREVAARLRTLLADHDSFVPDAYTRAASDNYVMYPLYVAPDGNLSVAAAVWGVGQTTPIHDHGTWGVVGIYGGVEHEVRYAPPANPGNEPPRYLGEHDILRGDVVVCCTSDQDIHKVSCGSSVPCVGVHVYGADIGTLERRAYDAADGSVRRFASAWSVPVAV